LVGECISEAANIVPICKLMIFCRIGCQPAFLRNLSRFAIAKPSGATLFSHVPGKDYPGYSAEVVDVHQEDHGDSECRCVPGTPGTSWASE